MIIQEFWLLLKSLPLNNLDLLSVGIAVAAIGIMGFIIFINNKASVTNRAFLLLSITAGIWSVVNYLSYQINTSGELVLWLNRFILFAAVWFAFSIHRLLYVFPKDTIVFSKKYKFLLFPGVIAVSLLTLTDLVFRDINTLTPVGQVSTISVGPGILIFGITVLLLNVGGVVFLHLKHRKAIGDERKQMKVILIGVYLTLGLILTCNFILPAFFNIVRFIPLGALFIFPFAAFTAYAVYKHHLFNVRAAAVAALTFVLSVAMLLEVVFSPDATVLALRVGIFALVLWASILMNRFVQTIAEQRESLQKANEGQENLMHIMNHQIKGYLGNNKNIFAELLTGDYGTTTDSMKLMLEQGLEQTGKGVEYIQNILKGASAAKGTLPYDMKSVDIKKIILDLIERQKPAVLKKGLVLNTDITDAECVSFGDASQLGEAFRNLVENAIKYNSPQGTIKVSLSKIQKGNGIQTGKILVSVKDTGTGISDEDKPKIFLPGGRGKDSLKYNPETSGFGLAFVKGVADAHKGSVRFVSNSPEKGTTFIFELPAA